MKSLTHYIQEKLIIKKNKNTGYKYFPKTKEELKLDGAVLITNPIPEESSMDKKYIDDLIDKAINEANERHITGKDVTPFLSAKIVEESEGKS